MADFRFLVFKHTKIPYLIATFLGGMLMGLTPAPLNAWPLAWVALTPLWVAIVQTSKQSRALGLTPPHSPTPPLPHSPTPVSLKTSSLNQSIFPASLLWGIGYHGLALLWITDLHPLTWLGIPWLSSVAIALFCWLFITLWGAAIVVVWAYLFRQFCTRFHILNPFTRVLIGAAIWCSVETLWSWGPLYWTSLSYTQSPYNLPILHLGQLSGQFTITAAMIAVNGLLAEAWMNRQVGRASPTIPTQISHLTRPSQNPKSKIPSGAERSLSEAMPDKAIAPRAIKPKSEIPSRAEPSPIPRTIKPKSKIQNPKSLALPAKVRVRLPPASTRRPPPVQPGRYSPLYSLSALVALRQGLV